ncbi:MAG TPA: 2-C-methyl-D-erythritol 2,4-cyclodiphosphate synthase [Acidobacteriota bacterium]
MERVGIGYDVHRLEAGRRLVLGGVELPFELGLAGHSDADVLSHAIADALLGALGDGDIGQHFPDRDERWRGVSSLTLLAEVARKVAAAGFRIAHIDSTLSAERPRIAKWVPVMRDRVAGALGMAAAAVSIKATTGEGLGFVGRGEGMWAIAIALLSAAPEGPSRRSPAP